MSIEPVAAILGILLITTVLWDAFETVVLPRRVARRFRLARLFYRFTWMPWSVVARRISGNWREAYLSFYGPLSLIFLLMVWAAVLILGFALLQWGLGSSVQTSGETTNFGTDIYMSGTTLFTLGIGDVAPQSSLSRAITVIEAGAGFGFLALVITYLPVLYQAFSRREVNVSLLDARAGSPPSAVELLRRLDSNESTDSLGELLREWERWSAELLESHLSYPVLALYRSQHEHQSWLAALTTILDVSALVISGVGSRSVRTAELTFAMARHAAVDLSQVFSTAPAAPSIDRLPSADFARVVEALRNDSSVISSEVLEDKLAALRRMYEPHVCALSSYLLMPLPSWLPADGPDDWQSSPWE